MKNIIFTICAKNYIGLCDVLYNSIKKYDSNFEFYIIVADELDALEVKHDEICILQAKHILNIDEKVWYDTAFKYDLTEFCTFLKPYCFQYLFNIKSANKIIYFDPDILVFNTLDSIWSSLNKADIFLTPHITTMQIDYTGDLQERNLLSSGLYNCGFIALRKSESTNLFLQWWAKRLLNYCYRNESESLFTDQKWIDFVPSLFPQDKYLISFDLGYNLAPWNFYEREVFILNEDFYVRNRLKDDQESSKLIFVHFSGFDYINLAKNKIIQKNISSLLLRDDLKPLFDIYSKAVINSPFIIYADLKYSYNYFDDMKPISTVHRKFFRRLQQDGVQFESIPFRTCHNSFYMRCKFRGLIMNINMDSDAKQVSSRLIEQWRSIYILNCLFKLIYKLIGARRYFMLVKLLRMYGWFENHTFIIDEKYMRDVHFFK